VATTLLKTGKDLGQAQSLPKPGHDQIRANPLHGARGEMTARVGFDDLHLLGETRQRLEQAIHLTGGLQTIQPTQCSNDPLSGMTGFPTVLDYLKITTTFGLLDSYKHDTMRIVSRRHPVKQNMRHKTKNVALGLTVFPQPAHPYQRAAARHPLETVEDELELGLATIRWRFLPVGRLAAIIAK
jgi:hypothetical protein